MLVNSSNYKDYILIDYIMNVYTSPIDPFNVKAPIIRYEGIDPLTNATKLIFLATQ